MDTLSDLTHLKDSCRLCMADENEIDLNSIYKGGIQYDTIASLLVELEFSQHNDLLSSRICQECASKLILFYKFKQKCESTNEILLAMIQKTVAPEMLQISDSNGIDDDAPSEEEEYLVDDATIEMCKIDMIEDMTTVKVNDNVKEQPKAKFQCEECGKVFSQNFGLVQHYHQHTGEKKYECKICKLRFTRPYNVTIHMRLHTKERPYGCELCSRKFVKSGDLARHRRVHCDEKNYHCSVCQKTFKRSADVISHMRSHTGEKRYKCGECEKAYSSHSGLKKHMRFHSIL